MHDDKGWRTPRRRRHTRAETTETKPSATETTENAKKAENDGDEVVAGGNNGDELMLGATGGELPCAKRAPPKRW